ncbi:chromosomal replication initiation ATPase DnaA [Sphingomonas sp. SORGH_AS 879]|nr:chromosomal replication initiation ATPase DnaA [Sphingomonas sp. SORGH_AS_0879]
MNQMALPLQWPADPRSDAFLLTDSNRMAARMLDQWEAWPTMAAILTGPRKSGRSLLARIFAARSGGTIIDDAERMPEVQIFHAWNNAQAERRPLLIVADAPPPRWQVKLPDLRSRLANSSLAEIAAPRRRTGRGAVRAAVPAARAGCPSRSDRVADAADRA